MECVVVFRFNIFRYLDIFLSRFVFGWIGCFKFSGLSLVAKQRHQLNELVHNEHVESDRQAHPIITFQPLFLQLSWLNLFIKLKHVNSHPQHWKQEDNDDHNLTICDLTEPLFYYKPQAY